MVSPIGQRVIRYAQLGGGLLAAYLIGQPNGLFSIFFAVSACFHRFNCAERDSKVLSAYPPRHLLLFVELLPLTVSDLFIFCDAGESRSTAIAAAILLKVGRSDDAVWYNPYYHPNTFVFGQLCKAFGIEMIEDQIPSKKRQSEDAFKNAMKRDTQYKRWEVI